MQINLPAPPSQFHDGQHLACVNRYSFSPYPFAVEKGEIYQVAHACQYGPAVCLVGQEKACFPDTLFVAVELASDISVAELLTETLSPAPAAPATV